MRPPFRIESRHDRMLWIALVDIYKRIDARCAAEHLETKRQGEYARRSIAQKARYRSQKEK